MKKFNYLFAVAALALASCSSDEIIESTDTSPGSEIRFRALTEAMTRAADANLATPGASFSVTAFATGAETNKFFGPVTFTTTDGTTFTSGNKYYWPESTNLDFYAYAPIGNNQVTLVDNNGAADANSYKIFRVAPSTTVAEQVDLVYANTDNWGKISAGTPAGHVIPTAPGVTINFRHTGAKIVLKVRNTNPTLKFEVSGWKIANVDGEATYMFNHGTAGNLNTDGNNSTQLKVLEWTSNSDAQTVSYSTIFATANVVTEAIGKYLDHNSAAVPSESTDETLNMILIPQTTTKAIAYSSSSVDVKPSGSYIAIKMVAKNRINDEVVATATADGKWAMWPVAFSWVPGKKYTYTIDLGDCGYWESNTSDGNADLDPVLENSEIQFVTVTVDGWSDMAYNVPPPTNLAQLRNLANSGDDCSNYIGYYVDATGCISTSNTDAIGVVAYIGNAAVDTSYPSSRIMIIPLSEGIGSNKTWATGSYQTTTTGLSITDQNAMNGYSNTEALYNLDTANFATYFPAAYHARNYNTTIPLTGISGSSPWFLPSDLQLQGIVNNKPYLNDIIKKWDSDDENKNNHYWSSTEQSGQNDSAREVFYYNSMSSQNLYKSGTYLVCPCFVY